MLRHARLRLCAFLALVVAAPCAAGTPASISASIPAAIPASIPASISASTPATSWRNFSDPFFHALFRDVDDAPIGIPHALARDGRGFVWVGYLEGLARWDGAEFKTYGADDAEGGPKLPEPSVSALHADRAGDLWVGLHSQGLVRYDAPRDAFVRPADHTALDHAAITDIADASDGGLWVASNAGLAHVDRASARVRLDRSGWLAGGVERLATSPSGVLWASHGGRLERRGPDGRWTTAYDRAPPIMGLVVDAARRVWVVARDGAITVLDEAGRPVRRLHAQGDASLTLAAITSPRNGRVWIASNEGLFAVDIESFEIRNVRHDAARSISLPQDDVTALLVDGDGLLWVGSDSAMAFADLDPREAFGLSSVFASHAADGHATPSVVRAGPDGALWLGQNNAALQRLDPHTGQLTPVGASGGAPAPRSVGALAFTLDGRLLAGGGNGLFEIDPDARVRRRLSADPVRRVLVDGHTLYVGDGQGLDRMDLTKPGVMTPAPGLAHGPGQSVNALARSASGLIWVGTIHGLYRLDPQSARVSSIRQGGDKRSSLDGYITTLRFDRAGRLWVGAVGGLFLVSGPDSAHPTVRRFGLADGLPNLNIDGVVQSKDGGVWVSTDKAIVRIDPVSFAMRRLSEAEGVAFANNWADGVDLLPTGEVVFAGVGGLTFIDPAFRGHAPAPAVAFTDLRLGERTLSPMAERIDVKPGEGALSISFASPDLAAADRIGFAYRLRGLDNAWTRVAAKHRSAEFTHLPPGHYTLEVQATDRQGEPGGAIRRLDVVAQPSLTQTWWFRAGLCLLALGIAAAALALRHRAQKRRQAHLESLVERRTSELRSSQAELERLAYFDPLTGLANRRMFQELLDGLLKCEPPQPFALLLGDLDRFKSINDTLGHDAGDALLTQVAARLASTVRARDSVCRLGGDEFALLIQDMQTPEEVEALCGRLLAAMEEPVFFQGRAMLTGLSLGVALHPAQATSAVEIYKLADIALYAAKAAGRGVWRAADPTLLIDA